MDPVTLTIGTMLMISAATAALSMLIGFGLNVLLSLDPPSGPEAGTLENFNLPTTAQGRAIQVIFGSPRINGYNDIWHGDLRVKPIKKKIKKNMFGNHKNMTVGYKYHLGFQYAWCAYAEALLEVRMDDVILEAPFEGDDGTLADGFYELHRKELPSGTIINYYRRDTLEIRKSFSSDDGLGKLTWMLSNLTINAEFYVNPSTSDTLPLTGWAAMEPQYGTPPTLTLTTGGVDVTGTDTQPSEVASSNTVMSINRPDLFGGKKSFGGVVGDFDICFGEATQTANAYLQGVHGTPIPAFRGMATIISNQAYIGTTTNMRKMDAIWKRTEKDNRGEAIWYAAKAEIEDDGGILNMNIAHIVYEIITDPDYSLGFASGVDEANFVAVADTLYTEGFGLSLILDVAQNGEKLLTDITGYANGFLRVDSATNKYQIKLMRDDFDIEDLDIIDESIITEVSVMTRSTSTEIYNQVSITYTDPASRKPATLIAQNTAIIEATGVVVNKDSMAAPVHSASLANIIATNALRTIGVNPFSATIKGNRKLAQYNLGDPIRLQLPSEGLSDVVVRVISVDLGNLVRGEVTLGITQDVFKSGEAIFGDPDSVITPTRGDFPIPVGKAIIFEVPYYLLATQFMDASTASLLDSGLGRPAVVAVAPSGVSKSYATYMKRDTEDESEFTATTTGASFATFCITTDALTDAYAQVVIGYSDLEGDFEDMDIDTTSWCQIGDEILRIESIDTDSEELTLGRGCLDTVPVAHESGSGVFFCSDAFSAGSQEYADGTTVDVQLLPTTNKGEMPLLSSPSIQVDMDHRYIRPYPPAHLDVGANVADCTAEWSHRDRIIQVEEIVTSADATDYGPETGTTYTSKLFRGTTLVDTDDTLTGTSKAWTPEVMAKDYGIYNVNVSGDGSVLGAFGPASVVAGYYRLENGSAYIQYDSSAGYWYYNDGTDSYKQDVAGTTLFGTFTEESGGVDTVTVGNPPTGDVVATEFSVAVSTQRDSYDSWQSYVRVIDVS